MLLSIGTSKFVATLTLMICDGSTILLKDKGVNVLRSGSPVLHWAGERLEPYAW